MSKCLVTGGAGFIGSHLSDRLIEMGHEVVVIDNLLLGEKKFVNKNAVFYELDIVNMELIESIFFGVDVVFHLAADPRLQISIDDPVSTHKNNITGTLSVLEAAKKAGVKKFIFSSSCSVYGDQPLPIKENMDPKPMSLYGLQKLAGEHYTRLYHELYGMETVSLRYFNVFGPRKKSDGGYPMVIPLFLRQKKEDKHLTIVGDGKQTRDYVYVVDVVNANVLAWRSKIDDGAVFNIGSGVQTSVNEIADLICGKTVNVAERPGEMRFIEADINKAKKLLNWNPTISLASGLSKLKDEHL